MKYLIFLCTFLSILHLSTSEPTNLYSQFSSSLIASFSCSSNSFIDRRIQSILCDHERSIRKSLLETYTQQPLQDSTFYSSLQTTTASATIPNKYAYHLILEEKGLNLYAIKYDLFLDKCGAKAVNVRILNVVNRRIGLFNMKSVLQESYRDLLEELLEESSRHVKPEKEQDFALFVTIHPSATSLPLSVIEDRVNKLKMDFPMRNIKYCRECENAITFFDYSHLAWYKNTKENEGYFFNNTQEKDIVNIGFYREATFISYLKEITSEPVLEESPCGKDYSKTCHFEIDVNTDRSQRFFAENLYASIKKRALVGNPEGKKAEIVHPCYPKSYTEEFHDHIIKGSGETAKCRKAVNGFIEKYEDPDEATDAVGLEKEKESWPLDKLQKMIGAIQIRLFIESPNLNSLVDFGPEHKYFELRFEELHEKIHERCNDFMNSQVNLDDVHKKKTSLNTCLYLLYELALLQRGGLGKNRKIFIKANNFVSQGWIKGSTTNHLAVFHADEARWFRSVQKKFMYDFLGEMQKIKMEDKKYSIHLTYIVLLILGSIFWAGMIVRFRKEDEIALINQNVVVDKNK